MNIGNILRNQFIRAERAQINFHSLRPNQIIQGKIVKLFPNHQALIQIGEEQRLAQLDTALVVGKKYYFQVMKNEQYIHLKVLGESIKQEMTLDIEALLKQLRIPVDRQMRQFIQYLIEEQIPFDRQTLLQSLPLLSLSHDRQITYQTLKQMISKQLPLTKEVFLALQTILKENFSNALQVIQEPAVQNLLKESSDGEQLRQALQDYLYPISEKQFNRHLIQLFKQNESLEKLFRQLQVLDQHISIKAQSLQSLLRKQGSIFNVELSMVRAIIQQLANQQHRIIPQIETFLISWQDVLLSSHKNSLPLSQEQMSILEDQLRPILRSFLSSEQTQQIITQFQQPKQIPQLLDMLVTLTNEKTFVTLKRPLANEFAPKIEFLQQIEHTLRHIGLNYEHLLLEDRMIEQPLALKQTLIQILQQQLPLDHDRIQQLIHFINGLQIQSVEETNHFIYGNFILPGEKLNLNSDLYMQFQSKKTKEQTIDPNHCRILFFLQLQTLNHTIIDMNVQNRVISLTVYNDRVLLKSLIKPLERNLRQRLEEMNYYLSAVKYKRLEERKDQSQIKTPKPFSRNHYSGVDFRI